MLGLVHRRSSFLALRSRQTTPRRLHHVPIHDDARRSDHRDGDGARGVRVRAVRRPHYGPSDGCPGRRRVGRAAVVVAIGHLGHLGRRWALHDSQCAGRYGIHSRLSLRLQAEDHRRRSGQGWRSGDSGRQARRRNGAAGRRGGDGVAPARKDHGRAGHDHAAGGSPDREHHRQLVCGCAQGSEGAGVHPDRHPLERRERARIQFVVQQPHAASGRRAYWRVGGERIAGGFADDRLQDRLEQRRGARWSRIGALWAGCIKRCGDPDDEGSASVPGLVGGTGRWVAQLLQRAGPVCRQFRAAGLQGHR